MLSGTPFRTLKSSKTRHKPLQNPALTALSSGWLGLVPGCLRVVPERRAHLVGMNEPHPFPELPTRLERLLSVQQLSDYLGVPVKTLYEWRTQHMGPRAVKVGRALRYPESRIAAWLHEQS